VFFVNATTVLVVVVFFAVAGGIVPVVFGAVPRVEGFSEFLQNALTGLAVQSFVLVVGLQLVFEVAVIGNLPGFLPHFAGVVVGDVPELAGTPTVPVKRLRYLPVVEDFRLVGSVDFQHSERSITGYRCAVSKISG
jgi:hypothetical protein